MSGRIFSLFDMAIAGVPVLIFCIWQLISINREIARGKKHKLPKGESPDGESPDGSGHAVGQHRLDDR